MTAPSHTEQSPRARTARFFAALTLLVTAACGTGTTQLTDIDPAAQQPTAAAEPTAAVRPTATAPLRTAKDDSATEPSPSPTPTAPTPSPTRLTTSEDPERGSRLSQMLERREAGRPTLRVVSPADGATIRSPIELEIEVENFELVDAGITADGEGHMHVLVDEPCLALGTVIPDDSHHQNDGSPRTTIDLPPGRHQICIQLSDSYHSALSISQTIEITVLP